MTRQAVTKHLGILETAKLVATVRRGREKLPSYDLGPFLVDPADRAALRGLPAIEPRGETS